LDVTKYKYPILAKPSGITLDVHRQNVIYEGALLVQNLSFTREKYQSLTTKDLARRVELVCQFHDEGKELSETWQTACQADYNEYLIWQKKNPEKTFKDYSVKEDSGKHIRKASVRHEFYSLLKNKSLPLALQTAIAAHHGKLGENFEERWINEGFKEYWTKFKKESYEEKTLEQTALTQYEFSGIRGLLQLADHRASAKEEGEILPTTSAFSYHFPHAKKRGVQKLIEQHWEDDLLLVRAPTGAGKTDASLLWASLQIENKRAERLIIAMPTRFTSNALAINVAESLSDTGLYHSSAWFTKFQDQIDAGLIEKQKATKVHEFARLLQTPITVCTIDHLLMALTLTREDHHLISFNMANACLVIDEADFYDDFTQANILVLLEILKYWKVPILLMSASLPESVLSSYQKIGYPINQIIEDTSDNVRDRFEIKKIEDYSELSEIEELLELCIEKGNAIIYANTVDRAVLFYNWFENRGENPILYHSRFTEPDKKNKEQELIDALGKNAWNNGTAKGIAIMTQIGEMSINISADLMISELCPIDRLTQRAGRLCRFDKSKIGDLYVLIPQKQGSLYPAPYGTYDRKGKSWIACNAFAKTQEMLNTTYYNAEKLVSMLNEVYSTESEISTKSITNARTLKEYFSYNWLISPKQQSKDDDTDTNYWKSRDIAAQDTVFVSEPETNYFNSYLCYQNWKLSNSFELPVYLIEKGKKNHMIDLKRIKIKDETETIWIIREGFYNKYKGPLLNGDNGFL
jgi:CRISPR-associated endonuclease/helicase Cas3